VVLVAGASHTSHAAVAPTTTTTSVSAHANCCVCTITMLLQNPDLEPTIADELWVVKGQDNHDAPVTSQAVFRRRM